jgi:hypothetical protein
VKKNLQAISLTKRHRLLQKPQKPVNQLELIADEEGSFKGTVQTNFKNSKLGQTLMSPVSPVSPATSSLPPLTIAKVPRFGSLKHKPFELQSLASTGQKSTSTANPLIPVLNEESQIRAALSPHPLPFQTSWN